MAKDEGSNLEEIKIVDPIGMTGVAYLRLVSTRAEARTGKVLSAMAPRLDEALQSAAEASYTEFQRLVFGHGGGRLLFEGQGGNTMRHFLQLGERVVTPDGGLSYGSEITLGSIQAHFEQGNKAEEAAFHTVLKYSQGYLEVMKTMLFGKQGTQGQYWAVLNRVLDVNSDEYAEFHKREWPTHRAHYLLSLVVDSMAERKGFVREELQENLRYFEAKGSESPQATLVRMSALRVKMEAVNGAQDVDWMARFATALTAEDKLLLIEARQTAPGADLSVVVEKLMRTRTRAAGKRASKDRGDGGRGEGGAKKTKGASDGAALVCNNCSKQGHVARDCRGPKGGRKCFTCNQPGHIQRDCPGVAVTASIGGPTGESRTCYNCGQPGHLARDCPAAPAGTGAGAGRGANNRGGAGRGRGGGRGGRHQGGGRGAVAAPVAAAAAPVAAVPGAAGSAPAALPPPPPLYPYMSPAMTPGALEGMARMLESHFANNQSAAGQSYSTMAGLMRQNLLTPQ
jgi:hypothetical protein